MSDKAEAGLRAFREGRFEDAARAFGQAFEQDPGNAALALNLGVALKACGRLAAATEAFRRVIDLDPGYAEAHFNLGNAAREGGDLAGAARSYRTALDIKPDYHQALNNLGGVLADLKRPDQAADIFSQVVAARPGDAQALNNWGNALLKLHKRGEAEVCFRRALVLAPDDARVRLNLGGALEAGNRLEEALAVYEEALEQTPGCSDLKLRRAMALLALGRFTEGWAAYEERWRLKSAAVPPGPRWDGAALDGARLLLWAEQGFGDAIQFARYAPLAAARGGRVVLACPGELTGLFETLDGVAGVVPLEPLPAYDLHAPLMSLPGLFARQIPQSGAYLRPDPGLTATWRARLGAGERIKVGLAWRGSPGHENDDARSMDPSFLAPLLDVPGVDFFSLQVGAPPPRGLCDLAPELNDFAETAAVMACLDLVISVDTAPAHLAGALGVPFWLALPCVPEWRWPREGGSTPWYGAARLFRQPAPGDWAGVVKAMVGALYDSFTTGA